MTTPPEKPLETAGPLRDAVYRRLWLANVLSGVGSSMHDTAAVWTMTALTASPALVTLMQTMSSLPLFLFALPAGAMADVVDRRRMVLWAQSASLVVAAALGLLALSGHITIGVLLGVTFLLGMGNAVTLPSWQAIIPDLVEKRELPSAIALNGVGVNIARGLGPVLGGLLLAVVGAPFVFLLNSATFIGFIRALRMWNRPAPPASRNSERMLGAVVAAFRYTRHSAVIHAVLIRNGWFVFCGIAPMALLPLVLRSRGAQSLEFGLQMGAYGVGGVVAAVLLLPRLRRRASTDSLLAGAAVVSASSIGGLGFFDSSWAVAGLMFTAGAAWLTNMTTLVLAGQSAFPNWVRARSSAIQLLVVQGSLALGAVVWGQVATHLDAAMALRIAAGGVLSGVMLIRFFPLSRTASIDLSPSHHWREHHLALEPQPEDGPVLVSIEYEVLPEHQEPFRAAIARLRRTRLRDGAFRWSLFHDLASPTHFRESFLVGSWAEHLRQHERATIEDEAIESAVIRFHHGADRPRASHFLMNDVSHLIPKANREL